MEGKGFLDDNSWLEDTRKEEVYKDIRVPVMRASEGIGLTTQGAWSAWLKEVASSKFNGSCLLDESKGSRHFEKIRHRTIRAPVGST